MTRTRCPDPRCAKPRATEEDNDEHADGGCTYRNPCVACRTFCWLALNPGAHVDLPEFGETSDRFVSLRAIERVTQDECTCGGAGPEHPKACPACKVYHRMMRLS